MEFRARTGRLCFTSKKAHKFVAAPYVIVQSLLLSCRMNYDYIISHNHETVV